MALFINRWDQPLHIVSAPVGDSGLVPDEGRPDLYRPTGDDTSESVCGMALHEINNQGMAQNKDETDVLRVSEMSRWDDLESFLNCEVVCESCLRGLPEVWPPAERYIQPDIAVVSERLCNLDGVNPSIAECLYHAGYYDEDAVREATKGEIAEVVHRGRAETIKNNFADESEPTSLTEDPPEGLGELFK